MQTNSQTVWITSMDVHPDELLASVLLTEQHGLLLTEWVRQIRQNLLYMVQVSFIQSIRREREANVEMCTQAKHAKTQ